MVNVISGGAHAEAAGLLPDEDVCIAIDGGQPVLRRPHTYNLALEDERLSPAEWLDLVSQRCSRYPVVSLLEDILHEDDWPNWGEASRRLGQGRQLIGDDLFATDLSKFCTGMSSGVANAVLVKPNQRRTLSRAWAVLKAAQAGQVKVGSTERSERTAKWNRLLGWRSKPTMVARQSCGGRHRGGGSQGR